ncbi:MAG: hypothetical protein CMP54_03540 [Flavobacteriales bacterium]|nr:hypothetical protein [Flavobacteriales bacterium]
MIKRIICLLLPIFFNAFTQDEQLRTEIIDVFKEYSPEIINSSKISQQPVFNDTLKTTIITQKSILDKHFFFKENLLNISPNKFRFNSFQNNFKKYISFDVGSVGMLNAKMHYTNGVSTIHNSGIYFESDNKSYLIKKDYDGYDRTSLNLYSNRFLNNKLLNTSFSIGNHTGLYWGGLTYIPMDSIERYNVSNITLSIDLHQSSNHQILHDASINVNYLFNNYKRKELSISSSVKLEKEKALKKYRFQLHCQLINNNSNHFFNSLEFNDLDHSIASINLVDSFSDIFLQSNFNLSGSNIFDYLIGLDFHYFPSEELQYGGEPVIFPTINLSHKISSNESLDFSLFKKLNYHSFFQVFQMLPYLDPNYRNTLSKEFNMNLAYVRRIGDRINIASDLSYIRERGSLIPFILYERPQNLDDLLDLEMAPLGLYQDKIQQGLLWSSSISYNQEKYNLLIEGHWNGIKSVDHDKRQFDPKFEINSTINCQIFKNINFIYNCYFKGYQDLIKIASIYNIINPIQYSQLPSYFNMSMSLNYSISSMVFSLDLQNILNQDQYFFDEYYNNDGLRISSGFLYKF